MPSVPRENEYESAKHENWVQCPSYRRKMSKKSQNMKSGPSDPGTTENECESQNNEKWDQDPR
jgi:hypothetical protein